jgi:hypothetical protein
LEASTDDGLLAQDRQHLESLDNKLRMVKDRVRSVVRGYSYGLYLYGAGGLGKTFSVLEELQDLEADFRHFNARMTAKGLFMALYDAPDAVHLLEDMERVMNDRDAQGVLRSALWAQPGKERVVTWTTAEDPKRVTFEGSIIMVANAPMKAMPELRALATRITLHKLEVRDREMAAHMRRIASGGFARGRHTLEAEHCLEVCAYVIQECRTANCPLDLRLLDNSCLDYLQWQSEDASCHWHDLVAQRVRQSAAHFREEVSPLTSEQRRTADRATVRHILQETADAKERVRLWKERTGKGKTAFYRRMREVESGEFGVDG